MDEEGAKVSVRFGGFSNLLKSGLFLAYFV